jgi:hypothetical protein
MKPLVSGSSSRLHSRGIAAPHWHHTSHQSSHLIKHSTVLEQTRAVQATLSVAQSGNREAKNRFLRDVVLRTAADAVRLVPELLPVAQGAFRISRCGSTTILPPSQSDFRSPAKGTSPIIRFELKSRLRAALSLAGQIEVGTALRFPQRVFDIQSNRRDTTPRSVAIHRRDLCER